MMVQEPSSRSAAYIMDFDFNVQSEEGNKKEKQAKEDILGDSQQLTSSDLSTQSWSPSHTHSATMQRPSPQRCSFVRLQSGEKEKL